VTAGLLAPAAQVCAFALGCALIHAGRAHAGLVTRSLAATAACLAVLVLLLASLACAPDEADTFETESVYAAMG
jgi:hypothetical protein